MAIDFDAKVLAVCASTFGEPVAWHPAAGPPLAVTAIFDATYLQVKWNGEQDISTRRPRLGCRVTDLGGPPAEGDLFIIRGRSYTVAEPPQADGIGHLEIFLHGPL